MNRFPTLLARRALLVGLVLLAGACARTDNGFSRKVVTEAAKAHFRGAGDIVYFEVASSGLLRDTAVSWLARLGIETASERGMLRALASSSAGRVRILVSGPVPDKTERIVEAALSHASLPDPSKVQLLVVASESQRRPLEEIGIRSGVQLKFASFREAADRWGSPPGAGRE